MESPEGTANNHFSNNALPTQPHLANRSNHEDSEQLQVQILQQKCKDMERQMQAEKLASSQALDQKQMELDSARKESQFKDAKLQASAKEAEQLRQEVQRLMAVEDELKRRCRENDETVKQVMANADIERSRIQEEMQKLHLKTVTLSEYLDDNARVLKEKAALDFQLRNIIDNLTERIQLGSDSRVAEVTHRLTQAEQQLKEARNKLAKAEKFAADMQRYAARQETEIKNLRQQLRNKKC